MERTTFSQRERIPLALAKEREQENMERIVRNHQEKISENSTELVTTYDNLS